MKKQYNENEEGYVLVGVMLMTALALLVTSGMLDSAASNTKTRALVTTQADNYYQVEQTLNNVVGWLQSNSKNIVTAFNAANFTANFDVGNPAVGDNEGQNFEVPTMVKMAGTNDSVMLSNNSFFGQSAFPTTTNIDSNAAFNPVTEFANADLGEANARVILVWARQTSQNYEPIFRIDVVTGNNPDRGVHSYSYVYSTLVTSNSGPGFFGRDSFTAQSPNNDCYSYQYVYDAGSSTWSRGAPRSNCSVNSDGSMNISSKINGTANTNLNNGLSFNPPGGDASGGACEGAGCHSMSLPVVGTWASLCSGGHSGDVTITVNQPLAAGCYRDLLINNNKTVTFNDHSGPYYFRNIEYGGNNAEISYGTIPSGKDITVYTESIKANGSNHINGKKFINASSAPHQVKLYYLGTDKLTMNGNVDMGAIVYAPNADVDVLGNFNFYGAIQAKNLYVGGNARINYDESLGGVPVLSDMNFALKQTSQRYR